MREGRGRSLRAADRAIGSRAAVRAAERACREEVREALAVAARLGEWSASDPPAGDVAVSELSRLLDAPALAYGVEPVDVGYRVCFGHYSHPSEWRLSSFTGIVLPGRSGWGLFDPSRPSPAQRNRAMFVPPVATAAHLDSRERRRYGIVDARWPETRQRIRGTAGTYSASGQGWEALDQVRALLCDGPVLLAWFGAVTDRMFTERERTLLSRLVPSVARRLKLERDLGNADLATCALDAALERLGTPAFVTDAAGRVRHANGAGRQLADADPSTLRASLRAALLGRATGLSVTRLTLPGLPPHALVLAEAPRPEYSARMAEANDRWRLSERDRQVLSRLVRGEANKTIAVALGLAESTVELRVTELFKSAGVSSRAQLAAVFWSGIEHRKVLSRVGASPRRR